MASESGIPGYQGLDRRQWAAPVNDLTTTELLSLIGNAMNNPNAAGAKNYQWVLDNILSDNYQFNTEFGENKRQYDTTREDRLALLDMLGISDGSLLGGIFGNQGGEFNDSIYNQLLTQQQGDRQRLTGMVQNYGQGEMNRINNQFTAAENSALAGLESRGLGASNLQTATRSGFAADKNQAVLDLNDQLLGRQLDLEQGMLGGEYDTMNKQLDRKLDKSLGGISLIGNLSGLFG